MKNSTLISIFTFACIMLISFNVKAQDFPKLDKSPMDAASFPKSYKESNKIIKIIYSRPQLNNRPIEKLVPKGEVWRTGANEACEITFYQDVTFGDQKMPSGTYTFFILNHGEKWTGIITKELNVWGSYSYEGDADIARFTVPVTEAEEDIEAFSIVFEKTDDGADMHLGWGKTIASFPFKF